MKNALLPGILFLLSAAFAGCAGQKTCANPYNFKERNNLVNAREQKIELVNKTTSAEAIYLDHGDTILVFKYPNSHIREYRIRNKICIAETIYYSDSILEESIARYNYRHYQFRDCGNESYWYDPRTGVRIDREAGAMTYYRYHAPPNF